MRRRAHVRLSHKPLAVALWHRAELLTGRTTGVVSVRPQGSVADLHVICDALQFAGAFMSFSSFALVARLNACCHINKKNVINPGLESTWSFCHFGHFGP